MYKILIVDDEESICFSMSEYFKIQGYQVDCALHVEEAQKLLAESAYSVVIEDLRLDGHGRDGLAMVQYIRERYPNTRVVVLTAYGSPEVEMEARKLGADAFLHKPKPLSEVAQVVYGLLGSRQEQLV